MLDFDAIRNGAARGNVKLVRKILLSGDHNRRDDSSVPRSSTSSAASNPMDARSILQSIAAVTPDDELVEAPSACRSVHEHLFGLGGVWGDDDDKDALGNVSDEHDERTKNRNQQTSTDEDPTLLLRALFMIPAGCTVPWDASIAAITFLQRQQLSISDPAVGDPLADDGDNFLSFSDSGSERTTFHRIIGEINSFLGDVGYWRGQKKQRQQNIANENVDIRSQRRVLQKLIDQVVGPLFGTASYETVAHEKRADGRQAVAILMQELLPTLLLAASQLEGKESTILSETLDRLFPSVEIEEEVRSHNIRPSMILNWLRIAARLSAHMTSGRWLYVRRFLQKVLPQIPLDDLAGLSTTLVELANPYPAHSNGSLDNPSPICEKEGQGKDVSTWYELLLRVYKLAGDADVSSVTSSVSAISDEQSAPLIRLLSSVENALIEAYSSLPSLTASIDAIRDVPCDDDLPISAKANLLLLIIHSYGLPGNNSMRSMIDTALSGKSRARVRKKGRSIDTLDRSCPIYRVLDLILGLAGGGFESDESNPQDPINMEELREYLLESSAMQVTAQGSKYSQYENLINRLESFVTNCMFRGCHPANDIDTDEALAVDTHHRAERIVDDFLLVIDHDAPPFEAGRTTRWLCFVLTYFGVVFHRIKGSRKRIVEAVKSGMLHSKDPRQVYVYGFIAALIVKKAMSLENAMASSTGDESACPPSSNIQIALRPFVEIFTETDPRAFDGVAAGTLDINQLDTRGFKELLLIMSNTPAWLGREAILGMANKCLSSSFRIGSEAIGIAIQALCLLLKREDQLGLLVENGACRDWCEFEALLTLSDLLVLRMPALPLTLRRTLCNQLSDMAQNGDLSLWVCARLERAVSVLLLEYFALEECDEDEQGSESNTASLRFAPTELFISWSASDTSNSVANFHGESSSLVEDIASVIQLLMELVKKSQRDVMPAHEFKQELQDYLVPILNGEPNTQEEWTNQQQSLGSFALLKKCLGAITSYLIHRKEDDTDSVPLKRCNSLQADIARVEKDIFEGSQQNTETLHACPLIPKWLELAGSSGPSTSSLSGDAGTIEHCCIMPKAIVQPICHLMIDILVGGDNAERSASTNHSALSMLNGINILIDAANACDDESKFADEDKAFVDNCAQTLVDFAPRYLEISAKGFGELLTSKEVSRAKILRDAKRLQMLLRGVESCCSNLAAPKAQSKGTDVYLTLSFSSLWKLYFAIASEKGSCKLVRFLDERLVRTKGTGLEVLKIRAHDDIDEVVRSVRINILSSVSDLLQVMRRCKMPIISVNVLLRTLEALIADLALGLKGGSGGITRNVFMSYLTTADACIEAILSLCCNNMFSERGSETFSSTDAARNAIALCQASSVRLWNIPCNFNLDKEARTFKTTLDMALSGLQSVRRHIEFVMACSGIDLFGGTGTDNAPVASPQIDMLTVAFSNCQELLRDRNRIRRAEEKVIPMVDIGADPDESDEMSDEESFGSVSARKIHKIPTALRNLRVTSPTACVWLQRTVFLAIETNWAESQTIIKARTSRTITIDLSSYTAQRHEELSLSLTCATAFLGKSGRKGETNDGDSGGDNDSEEDEFHDSSDEVLAERLPSSTKVRFCSLLERIAVTLKAACRFLLVLIKESQLESPEDFRSQGNDIRLSESLATLCAWISSDARSLALTSGSRRWYHNERTRYRIAKAKAKEDGRHIDQDSGLSRLPKLLHQIEELEVAFQKVTDAATTLSKKKECGTTVLSSITAILPPAVSEISSSRTRKKTSPVPPKSFVHLLSAQKHSLTGSKSKTSKFDMALIKFEDKEDELNTSAPGKRKRRGRNTAIEEQLRKARRNVLRSRNEVVDEWLNLDSKNEDKANSVDCFADLEDFLVEG